MVQRIRAQELLGLAPKHANFVIEYCKDFHARRAATASGFAPDSGYDLIKRDDVAAAIDNVLAQRLEASHIDAEWALMEAVDNHLIARQSGNISASNTSLGMIMKHNMVDALAADKVEVSSDKEVMERLLRGRKRLGKEPTNDADSEVSFF